MVAGPQGVAVAFVLFTLPGFPKDYLSYRLGLTPMRWRSFLFVSTLGCIPGTRLLSAQGAAANSEQYGSFAALVSLAGAVLLLFFLYRHAIVQWLQRLSGIEGGDFPQRRRGTDRAAGSLRVFLFVDPDYSGIAPLRQ